MKSGFSVEQLDAVLQLFYTSLKTDNPTDERIKKAYQKLSSELYPLGEKAPLTPLDRNGIVLLRRALERAHPFLLQDKDVISQEKRRSPADSIDIIHFAPKTQGLTGRGILILRRGKHDQIMPFYGDYSQPPTISWESADPPLHTLLANLMHRRRAVQYDTPVREFEGTRDRTGRLMYAPTKSAMALWAYLDELG